MKIAPREYQRDALDAIIRELRDRVSTLVDIATGGGKTYLFAWLAMLLGGRVLIVVHRDELKRQAIEKIRRVCPDIGVSVEQGQHRGDRRRDRSLFEEQASSIVVASKDTLSRPSRLRRFRSDDFDFIIIDEAHRCIRRNESYAAIVRYFCRPPIGTGTAKLIGVSASLDRLDGEALGGLFQSVAYRYSIGQAIDDGYLLEVKVKRAFIKGLRLAALPTGRTPDGEREVSQQAIDRAMRTREYAYGIAGPLLDLAGRTKQGIVFCSSEPQATFQMDVLNAESCGCASLCLGEPYQSADERRAAQDRFRGKGVQFLVTCAVLGEGFDYDGVEIVVPRISKSRSAVAQMVGRGTRPLEGCVDPWHTPDDRKRAIACSPKPWCTVLDACGVSEEHSLVNVTDIFRGRYTAALSQPKLPLKPTTAPADLAERRALRNALAAIEAERLDGLRVEVDYELLDTDMMGDPIRKAGAVSKSQLVHPATERQCRYLESSGFRVPPGMSKRDATAAIGEIRARQDAGPASPGQKGLLARLGLPIQVTYGEARVTLDRAIADRDCAEGGADAHD